MNMEMVANWTVLMAFIYSMYIYLTPTMCEKLL